MIMQHEVMQLSSKNFMNAPMPMQMKFMSSDGMLGKYMLQGSKCKKNHSIWSFCLKVMPI
jgi:hypothetical protein